MYTNFAMIMNFLTLLIPLPGIIRLILASPVITEDGVVDEQPHALDDWINQSNGVVSISDNPNRNAGDDCSVVNLEGAEIPGKVSYPRDCTTLSVWKNSFEEDRDALVSNPDSCRPFFSFFSSLFLLEESVLYPFTSFVLTRIQIKPLSRKSSNAA